MLIIAVSYDFESLNRRIVALESAGHAVIPASSLESCTNAIFTGAYHVLVIGATVVPQDRLRIVKESRSVRPQASIVSVEWEGADRLQAADVSIPAGDEGLLLETLRQIQYGR